MGERVCHAGDFGRRVAERRRELGLTLAQLGARAGMHPSFVKLIEEGPSRQLTRRALGRLSVALETSIDALSGAGMLAPPGRTAPFTRAALTRLDPEACNALMAPGGIGRLVMTTERGPVAVPVNYKMLGRDVVFRTMPSAEVCTAAATSEVSFEVDHFDDVLREGWSVLLTGKAHSVSDPEELATVADLGIRPWVGGNRDRFMRISPGQITGRSIRGA